MIIPETWKINALVAVAAAVAGTIFWLLIARANLKADLAQSYANYAMCQSANADWAAHASEVNAAISKLQAEAEARQASAEKAMRAAEEESKKHELLARRILSSKIAGGGCKAAQDLVRDYLKSRK